MTNIHENASEDSLHENVQRDDPILSDEARLVLEIVFYSTLGCLIGVVGSVANVINFVVFVKQGFRDSVGVSLCALAVSDLGFLLQLITYSVCSNPLVQYLDTCIDIAEMYHNIGGDIVSCFLSITTLITAFITFERCFCIALPLRVNNIITPKRTLISMVVIYVILFAINLPIFSQMDIGPTFNAKQNKTRIRLTYSSQSFQNISYSFNAFTQISSFILVIISTVVLVMKLLSKSQWRTQAISISALKNGISTRNKKVIQMIITISTIFIACYLPSVINLILIVYLSPEYSVTGSYKNAYSVSWAFIDSIDGINSSVTILIYYNMSSKFRATFKDIFVKTTK